MQENKKHVCKQCGKVFFGKGNYCGKHRAQLGLYGKFLDSNPRSKRDPNEYTIKDDYVEVITYDKDLNPNNIFKVSLQDLPLIINYKWSSFVSKTKINGESLTYLWNNKLGLFHRYVMNAEKSQTVDHINRDTFDNRRENLRIISYSDQNHNTQVRDNCKFDIKGIDKHKDPNRKKRYMASFNVNKKKYISPWYLTYEEAVFARYLLQQLSNVNVINGDMTKYINKLTDSQKQPIIKWFNNKFKDQV